MFVSAKNVIRNGLLPGGGGIVENPRARRDDRRLHLAVALLDDRDLHDANLQLAKVVDDDVHEPGAQGAVLLGVGGLLAVHGLLLLRAVAGV
jgi:hypothetical protein